MSANNTIMHVYNDCSTSLTIPYTETIIYDWGEAKNTDISIVSHPTISTQQRQLGKEMNTSESHSELITDVCCGNSNENTSLVSKFSEVFFFTKKCITFARILYKLNIGTMCM